jgi:hypothetical protein
MPAVSLSQQIGVAAGGLGVHQIIKSFDRLSEFSIKV